MAGSASRNWPPLLAAEPPESSSSRTPHATSAATDRGSTATRPFVPRGCPGAGAACGVGGGGERRIRSLMSMPRGVLGFWVAGRGTDGAVRVRSGPDRG